MGTEARNDVSMSGLAQASGGVYRSFTVTGSARVDGDVDCIEFRITGAAQMHGGVKAEKVEISGSAKLDDGIESETAKVSGMLSAQGNLTTRDLKISGMIDLNGSVKAETIELSGAAKIAGDCTAETFKSRGGFDIHGLLNAETVSIEMFSNNRVKEIGGEKISATRGTSGKRGILEAIFSSMSRGTLTAETIEGDDIYLDYTRAKVVRAGKVKLGPGCDIDLVEYRESFEKDEDTTVHESRKT